MLALCSMLSVTYYASNYAGIIGLGLLHAVRLVLESLIAKLNNCTIRWFTDDQNVACILQVGSKTPLLQKEALSVFSLSVAHNISIEPE